MLDIEITYDPIEDAVLSGSDLDENFKLMPDGDWIRHARRVTNRDDLVMCHHLQNNTFVLCQMQIDGDIKVVNELSAFDKAPDRGGWMSDEILILQCRPDYIKIREIQQARAAKKANEKRLRSESELQRQDTQKHLRNQGMSAVDASRAMTQTGNRFIGDEEGGESLAMQRERLIEASKNKVSVLAQ